MLAAHGYPFSRLDIRIAEYTAKAVIDRTLAPAAVFADVEGLLWPAEGVARPSYFGTILHQLGIPAATQAAISAALQAHNEADCLWRVVDPETPSILEALRQRGFTLAVISNADGRVEADLERRGLREYFATVIDSHVVGVEKPDPAIFALALDRVQAAADAAVYVGDVWSIDVLGARKAGLHAILVDTLSRYRIAVDCPRITRLAELLDVLPTRAA